MTKKLKLLTALVAITAMFWTVSKVASAHGWEFTVEPQVFDPAGTHLVVAEWESGIGCPSIGSSISLDGSTLTPYNDPACPTGDADDKHVEGLLLAKTGPTPNFAAAVAALHGVKGMTLNELGYDIRKPGVGFNDPRGSHCGAGAPRFNIVLAGQPADIYFLGCDSPAPTTDTPGKAWQRLRWGGPLLAYKNGAVLTNISGAKVESIEIVFDEGDDTGPDNFGAAVLDNIDVNGVLVGKGREEHENHGNKHE